MANYMVIYPVQADSAEEAAVRAVDQMQDPAAFPPLVTVMDAWGEEASVDMSGTLDVIRAYTPPF